MKEDWQYHWTRMFNSQDPVECFESYWWLQSKANPIGPKTQKGWSVVDAQQLLKLHNTCLESVLQYRNEFLQKQTYNGTN